VKKMCRAGKLLGARAPWREALFSGDISTLERRATTIGSPGEAGVG
jgi:hypothetical protein